MLDVDVERSAHDWIVTGYPRSNGTLMSVLVMVPVRAYSPVVLQYRGTSRIS